MIFNVSTGRVKIAKSKLKFAKVLYNDGYYELMGYHAFDERFYDEHEVIVELKNWLMDIFGKLENAEIKILREDMVDTRGKLNYKDFCDTKGSLTIGTDNG